MKRKMIKRDFRQMGSPARFMAFCKKVQHAMTDNPNLPDSVLSFLKLYLEKVAILETTYHQALDGGRTLIRQRESLCQEIVVLLDQMASLLEAAFILNPDALLTTGFTVTQERRNTVRVKLPLTAPADFNVSNSGELGKALGKASSCPGALVYEIHFNVQDPSVEAFWFHKSNYIDPQQMVMDGLAAGNTFFRMRPFGEGGPGPWSGVVSTPIT